MKRAICTILSLMLLQIAFASSAGLANIRIRVAGALNDNTYFLCLPNVGCLSILAAAKGKVYSVPGTIHMNGIFLTDVDHGFRVTPEGLPPSCNVTVSGNQTITISGQLNKGPNQTTLISHLHCSVST